MGNAPVIFIAGPTASGKSAAALTLAEALNGEIVNADAMQIYRDLRIVTARPSTEDEARAPHRLYGVLDGAERCSAGRWAGLAVEAIKAAHANNKTPILVGGTGLYFKALEQGLSPIPDVPNSVREAARLRRDELGSEAFRGEVLSRDPEMAHLPAGRTPNGLFAPGKSTKQLARLCHISKNLPREPLIDLAPQKAVILPERQILYARCDARAATMFEAGAIEEVELLLVRGLDPSLPVMKTLGVPEVAAFLKGELSRQENARRTPAKHQTFRQTTDNLAPQSGF